MAKPNDDKKAPAGSKLPPEDIPSAQPESDEGEHPGMGAVEPVEQIGDESVDIQVSAPSRPIAEGGMGAAYPIIRDEEMPIEPGLPDEEMKQPDKSRSMRGAPMFSATAFLPPGPVSGMELAEATPVSAERLAKEELVALLVTDEQLKELWGRAKTAVTGIHEGVTSLQIGRGLLDQVKYFRNEILSGRDRFEEAERYINEVELRVVINQRVQQWSYGIGLGLFFYELLWAVLVILVLVFWLGTAAFTSGSSELTYLVGSMAWGGLGGVIGAWYALVKHIAVDQDFDRQHRMWYLSSPLMGIGVGAVVYAVLRAGLLSLTGPNQGITSPFIIYLLAWLAGYQHNVFTEIVKRILKVFRLEESEGQVRAGTATRPRAFVEATPTIPAAGSEEKPAEG